MASPWFEALSVPFPDLPVDQIERFARGSIDEFVQYLRRAKTHQETTAIRVAWQRDDADQEQQSANGVWVELCAPAGENDRFERDLRKFFGDQVREVYEASSDEVAVAFDESRKIAILDADENTGRLLLDREPEEDHLLLRPNTYAIHRQTQAMLQLKGQPRPENLPLLRLLGPARPKDGVWPTGRPVSVVEWPEPETAEVNQWFVLARDIEGAEEQRTFVRQALASPDFSILEGPPGSGKTTVICELVMQLVEQGKRVLLCASTHVAVDNVLERLKDKEQKYRDHVLAVRIGDQHKVSAKAQPYRLEEFKQTVRRQITSHLQQARNRTPAQNLMVQALRGEEDTIERIVLQCANLVCGTTIGILQHPDIRAQQIDRRGVEPVFDVLIVDEASKTTFQEFLVPALLAKRWVLVGDPQQLSPYVDDDEVAANVQAALPSEAARDACLDVFDNMNSTTAPERWKPVIVVSDDPAVHEVYARQAEAHGVAWVDGDTSDWKTLHSAPLILTTSDGAKRAGEWPADAAVIRGSFAGAELLRRRAAGYPGDYNRERKDDSENTWESQIAWRLSREYEQRLFERDGSRSPRADAYRRDRERLLPAEATGIKATTISDHLLNVQRVALPSVLESLRLGFGRRGPITPTTLTEGFAEDVLRPRHTKLSYQRRMHPEISRFPRDTIYHRQALLDPADMAQQRAWSSAGWDRYVSRAAWLDVQTRTSGFSEPEAEVVVAEIREFLRWAARNPRPDGRLWQIAVLTFYRAQERLLRRAVQPLSGERHPMEESTLRLNGRDVASAHVCTVDRFQGHEADIVFLSVANRRATSFLESPNRINVAVTRARYQLVVVGHRHAMLKCRSPILSGLAKSLEYGLRYGRPGGGQSS
ncbi:MAG: AAA family ATPase [Phycisphaeraceae bacterium]|nr:AAA family ATPase [Phycisphaeraceae bacterium]